MTVSQPLHFTPSAIKIAPFPVLRNRDAAVLTQEGKDCAFHLTASWGPKEQSVRKDIFPSTFPTLALLCSPLPSSLYLWSKLLKF